MWNPFKKKISPTEAYQSNFFLAFDFIPMVVGLYNDRKLEEQTLSDIKNWKGFINNRLKPDIKFDWDNTVVSTTDVNNNPERFIVLIRFAKPYTMAAAKAGLIVGSRKNHYARFFTLECSIGGNMICECVGKNHSNFGITLPDSDDLSSFLISVLKIIDKDTTKKNNNNLNILYFYMKSKMTDNQDALLKGTPLILPVKRVDLNEDEVLQVKYNIRFWPVFVLVDENGKELHRWQGLTKGQKINDYITENLNY